MISNPFRPDSSFVPFIFYVGLKQYNSINISTTFLKKFIQNWGSVTETGLWTTVCSPDQCPEQNTVETRVQTRQWSRPQSRPNQWLERSPDTCTESRPDLRPYKISDQRPEFTPASRTGTWTIVRLMRSRIWAPGGGAGFWTYRPFSYQV